MEFATDHGDEMVFHRKAAMTILIQAFPIFLILHFAIPAPWGKTISYSMGPLLPAKLSWFVFESPNLIWCSYCWSNRRQNVGFSQSVLLGLFFLHYVQRALLYPLLMSSNTTKMPTMVVVAAFVFCLCNGYVQAQSLCQFASFPEHWHIQPQFVAGVALFGAGMWINVSADATLRRLRALSPNRRQIPQGGLFELVSTPHYFGEIVEWLGYCIACNFSLASVAFLAYTAANLIPRGVAHHKWYKTHFPCYPADRKAVLPYVW